MWPLETTNPMQVNKLRSLLASLYFWYISPEDIDDLVAVLIMVGKKYGLIGNPNEAVIVQYG